MLKGFCRWFWGWEFYTFNISPVRNEAIGPLAGIEPATPANHTVECRTLGGTIQVTMKNRGMEYWNQPHSRGGKWEGECSGNEVVLE